MAKHCILLACLCGRPREMCPGVHLYDGQREVTEIPEF